MRPSDQNERAQSEVIGFVLLFAVLILVAVGWQVGVVPEQNERVEVNHVGDVQSQMQELGATVGSMASGSGPRQVPVSLGQRFPDRTLFLNPPPTGGRLATLGSDAEGFAANVTNATAVDAEVDDYWTGENKSFGTAAFVYDPLLQAYDGGPDRIVYENSLVYSTYGTFRRQHADQGIVNGRDVNLALVNGSYSKASSGEVTPTDVPLYPASSSPTTVRVRNTSGPIQIRVPTDLDQSEWEDRLSDELDDTGPDDPDAYVKNVEVKPAAIGPEDWNLLVLTLEGNETYRLQVSKVRVGSPPKTGERPEYVTVVDGNTATVREGSEHRVTFEVRDRYDNPVSDTTVNVSLRNGDPGALYFEGGTNTTDVRTGPDGRVTVTYAAGGVDGDQDVSVRVNRSGSSSFNRDQNATAFVDFTVVDVDGSGTGNTGNGAGGGGAYTVQWNASRGVSGTPTVTVDTSKRSTLRLNATTADFGNARVEFSVNDSSRISINRADDRSASNRTARVTFDVSGTGYVYAYVTGGGSGDRVRVKLEQSGDTTDPSVDVTSPGAGSTTRAPSVSGTASDDVAVAGVELQIQRDDGSYWNGGSWQSTATTVAASASDGSFDDASESWTYSLAGVGDAAVSVTATATDGAGNDATATRAFTRYRGLHVNFQPETATVPGGYVKDYSQAYQQVGDYTYGWNGTYDETRDRNAVSDQRYDTLNHLEHTGDPDRMWELAVPDGTYTVRVAMGDPSNIDQNNTVTVEGTRLVDEDGWDNFDEYTATVTVTDGRLTIAPGSGSYNSKVTFVDVAPVGNASVPAFTTSPSDPIAGEPVTFDASGTTDPQGDVVAYRWNWDDDSTFEATGATATQTFATAGTYTVTLEVLDADGNNATVTRNVTVTDGTDAYITAVEPNPTALADNDGEFVAVNVTGSTDTSDWVLRDDEGDSAAFPATTDGVVWFVRNETAFRDQWVVPGDVTVVEYEPGGNGVLANSGDAIEVVNTATGERIDEFAYEGPTTSNGWTYSFPSGTGGQVAVRDTYANGTYVDTDDDTDWSTTDERSYFTPRQTATLVLSPDTATTQTSVTLDASGSVDRTGTIEYYLFDVGEGYVINTTSATTSYVFDCAASYDVEVTMVAEDGTRETATETIDITNATRNVVATLNAGGSTYTSCEGVTYRALSNSKISLVSGGTRSDASAEIDGTTDDELYQTLRYIDGNDDLEYEVDLPDGEYRVTMKFAERYSGTFGDGLRVFDVVLERTTRRTALDVYESVGPNTRLDLTYNVTVTDGTLDMDLLNDVENPMVSGIMVERLNGYPDPEFTTTPASPTTQNTITFDASATTDPDGDIQTYQWDFDGDGTVDATGETVTHEYADNGSYGVTLSVRDAEGVTNTTTRTVQVDNVGPNASFDVSDSTPHTQQSVQFTDQSTDLDGSVTVVQWDFGDGSTSTATDPTHEYESPGTYVVELTVEDDDGARNMTTTTVEVGGLAMFGNSGVTQDGSGTNSTASFFVANTAAQNVTVQDVTVSATGPAEEIRAENTASTIELFAITSDGLPSTNGYAERVSNNGNDPGGYDIGETMTLTADDGSSQYAIVQNQTVGYLYFNEFQQSAGQGKGGGSYSPVDMYGETLTVTVTYVYEDGTVDTETFTVPLTS